MEIIKSFLSVLIFLVIVGGVYFYKNHQCNLQYADYSPSYNVIAGCMIIQDGKRIPAKNLRA
jgi:hypothetical protein